MHALKSEIFVGAAPLSASRNRRNRLCKILKNNAAAIRIGAAASLFAGLGFVQAFAQEANGSATPPNPKTGSQDAAPQDPGFMTGLFASSRSTLLGDMWGLRSALVGDQAIFGLRSVVTF
jgi:hypothetical protein